MIDALRFPFTMAAVRATEDAEEDFGDFPVNCNYCRTPIFADETVPGHLWCGIDTEQDGVVE